MKSLLIALLICLNIPQQLKAQEIPKDYDFVGEINLEEGRVIGGLLLYKFGEYAVIDFGYKPTTIEVYYIDTWEVVQTSRLAFSCFQLISIPCNIQRRV